MDNLNPDNNVPRQATFETEPADTVHGRSIKRGDINIPFIDSKAVKNGQHEPVALKDKDALKREQLKSLKVKEQKERELKSIKDKELRDLKEKKEKVLKAHKEKLLKANNDKNRESNSQKANPSKSDKERELKSLKEKELKAECDNELKAQKEKELKSQKENEVKAQKERNLKAQKEREPKAQKERELKAQKERELKAQKERELKAQKERELKAQKEIELKVKENEKKAKRETELQTQRYKQTKSNKVKEIKLQQDNQKELKEKNQKSKEGESKADATNKKEEEAMAKKEKKPGFLSRMGRSWSPSKKQTSPTSTNDPKSNANQDKDTEPAGNGDETVPPLLLADDDRFAEVRVPTPVEKPENVENEEKAHFKAIPPRSTYQDDTQRSNSERNSNASLTVSKDDYDTLSRVSNENDKPSLVSSKIDAWSSDTNASQFTNNSKKIKVLHKFNSNSPRSSQPDEESVDEPARSRKAAYLRHNPQTSNTSLNVRANKKVEDDSTSFLSSASENDEPYDQVLAERDCLLTAEIAYKRRIRQLEEETNQLAEALEKRDNDIKEFKWNIENPSVNEVTHLTKKFQDQIEKLQKEIDDLKKEKKKYKILHNDSERKITEIEQENDQLKDKVLLYEQDKVPKIEELQLDNKKLDEKLKQLKTKTKETEEHFEIMKNENKELADEVRSRRNEVQELLLNLKNQKMAELDVVKAGTRLEERLKKLENVEKELANSVANSAIIEAEKEHVQSLIKDKEIEIKAIQDIVESKENDIDNHKLAVELQKEEIDNLKQDIEKQKTEIEKVTSLKQEIASCKETLKTLQNDLDDSQKENKTLKEDIEGGKQKIVRIQEHVQASSETNESLRKVKGSLEAEMKRKGNLEVELAQSKEEVSKLQQQNMELNIKVGNLNDRLKTLEYSNQNGSKRGSKKTSDLDEKLVDENRRLKIRLVETNFDQLNVKDDKQALSSRLEHLERKQVDNDVKVDRLQGWVDEIISDSPSVNRLSPVPPYAARPPNNVIPRVAVAVQSDRTKSTKLKKQRDTSPRPTQAKKPNTRLAVSLSDNQLDNETSGSSTPSLPAIKDIPEQVPVYNSYFYLYKQKQKLMRQQQKIR